MGRNVETLRFLLLADAQAALEAGLHDEGKHHIENADEHDGDGDTCDLAAQQAYIAGVQKAAEVGPGQLGHAEDAGADAAHDTADRMATESVERVIVADLGLAERDGEVADRGNDQAHDDRGPGLDESSRRG